MFLLLIAVAINQKATPSIIYNRLVQFLEVKRRNGQDVLIIGKLLRASATNPHGKLCVRTRVMTGSNGNNAEDWTIRCDYLTTLKEGAWYGIIDRTDIGSFSNKRKILRYSQALSERLEIKASSHSMLTDWVSPCSKRSSFSRSFFQIFQFLTKNLKWLNPL